VRGHGRSKAATVSRRSRSSRATRSVVAARSALSNGTVVAYETAAFTLTTVLDLWAHGKAYQPTQLPRKKSASKKLTSAASTAHAPFRKRRGRHRDGPAAGPTPAFVAAIDPRTVAGLREIAANVQWKVLRGTAREQFGEETPGEFFGPHLLVENSDGSCR
jgi:hypothetical protein